MEFISTRSQIKSYSLTEALTLGLAPDGGLFIPKSIPKVSTLELKALSYPELSYQVLKPFFEGDPLSAHLKQICKRAFDFPLPVKELNANLHVAELFHGPTLAFKDFGARFLAECLSQMDRQFTILVATSGDTGGAVAHAFYKKRNIKVGVLFPRFGVSKEQYDQLTSLGENIFSFSVNGTFDDCQKLVKDSFASGFFKDLTSANSVNIGRVLAQMTYYAFFSLKGHKNIVIPSGNVGNSLGAFWAKAMGFPIENIVLASNANKAIGHFHETRTLKAFPTIKTYASAMDVGNPSNLERLSVLNPPFIFCQTQDSEIIKTIEKCLKDFNYLIDPHTAVAMAYAFLNPKEKLLIMSTAHPVKFKSLLLEKVPESKMHLPSNDHKTPCHVREIEPELSCIRDVIYG